MLEHGQDALAIAAGGQATGNLADRLLTGGEGKDPGIGRDR